MILPEKEYFNCAEICKRWRKHHNDVQYVIEKGFLPVHIFLKNVLITEGIYNEHSVGNMECSERIIEYKNSLLFKGYKRLLAEDCYFLFRRASLTIKDFFVPSSRHFCHADTPVVVQTQDLIIRKEDVLEFEDKTHFYHKCSTLPLFEGFEKEKIQPLKDYLFFQKNDYHYVEIKGVAYTLGHKQSMAIKILHEASQKSDPWVIGKGILIDIQSNSNCLRELFRRHPIREHIVSNGRGYYRLKI